MKSVFMTLCALFVLLALLSCSSKPAAPTATSVPTPSPTAIYDIPVPPGLLTSFTGLYVCVSVANVRSGAGTSYPVVKQYTQGTTLSPEKKEGEWYYLGKDSSGVGSYIHESVVCTASASTNAAPTATRPAETSCPTGCIKPPPGCAVKGNIVSKTGDKIYYLPSDPDYDAVIIDPDYGERWFCTDAEARANGWTHTLQ